MTSLVQTFSIQHLKTCLPVLGVFHRNRTILKEVEKQQWWEREIEEARRSEDFQQGNISQTEETVVEIRQRTDRNGSEIDTECRGQASQTATECLSRLMRLYLTLSRIMRSFVTKPVPCLRTKPGKIECGKNLQASATSQQKCARLGLNPKGLAVEN